MSSVRLMLKDHQWERMQPHLPGKPSDPGRTGADNRLFVEAILWLARTGMPWRDLPPCFGNWNSVFIRFPDGPKTAFGIGSLRRWPTIRTLNTS